MEWAEQGTPQKGIPHEASAGARRGAGDAASAGARRGASGATSAGARCGTSDATSAGARRGAGDAASADAQRGASGSHGAATPGAPCGARDTNASGTQHSACVTLHVLNALDLRGYEEECRRVVAPRYIVNVKRGPGSLEALGGGLLARELLGVTRDDQLATNEHGKPLLVQGGPVFNLSNDNGLVVLGILDKGEEQGTVRAKSDDEAGNRSSSPVVMPNDEASNGSDSPVVMSGNGVEADDPNSIGVDVNEVPNELDRIKLLIARKYFLPAETAAVGDGTSLAQRIAFARAWGNLEAALKAMGTGFDFDVRHHREALKEWQLAALGLTVLEGSCVAGDTPAEIPATNGMRALANAAGTSQMAALISHRNVPGTVDALGVAGFPGAANALNAADCPGATDAVSTADAPGTPVALGSADAPVTANAAGAEVALESADALGAANAPAHERLFVVVVAAHTRPQLRVVVHDARTDLAQFL